MDLIPDELRRSHEDGEVVFFCGAGVSVSAGLPSFRNLVKAVLMDLLPPPPQTDCQAETTEALAWQAFEDKRYDEALDILESPLVDGYEARIVRAKVRHHLSEPGNGNLAKHLILTRLADLGKEHGRLVTTNFDSLFEEARGMLRTQEASIHPFVEYIAPALPPAKPETFRGLVHLHGKLGSSPNDRQLVLTTADFGMAYMLEGWARRFVVDLFRHYRVVFIGYSVEDPTMRYLVSALAAAREESPLQFKAPYALVPYDGDEEATDAQEAKQRWKLKGMTPLLYHEADEHQQLWYVLRVWADDHCQGIEARRQKVARLGQFPPADKNDPAIGEMAWALQDRDVARYFANLTGKRQPKPGWIPLLQEQGLFGLPIGQSDNGEDIAAPLVLRQLTDHIGLNEATFQLGRWVAKCLDSREALEWALTEGTVLHGRFRQQIRERLSEKSKQLPLPLAFRKIWRVLADDDYAHALSQRCQMGYDTDPPRLAPDAVFATRIFLNRLRPIPIFELDYFQDKQDPNPECPSDLCEIDIKLVGIEGDYDLHWFRESAEDWEGALAAIADDLTTRLREAMDWLREFDRATQDADITHIAYPSISDHGQSGHTSTWTQLIALARDAYDALVSTGNNDAAARLAQRWQSLPYPVFRRLALYAATRG